MGSDHCKLLEFREVLELFTHCLSKYLAEMFCFFFFFQPLPLPRSCKTLLKKSKAVLDNQRDSGFHLILSS